MKRKILTATLLSAMVVGLVGATPKSHAYNGILKLEDPSIALTEIESSFNLVNKDDEFFGKKINEKKVTKYLDDIKTKLSRVSTDNKDLVHDVYSHGILSADESAKYLKQAAALGYNISKEDIDYTYEFLTNKNIITLRSQWTPTVPVWSDALRMQMTSLDKQLLRNYKYGDLSYTKHGARVQTIVDKRLRGDEVFATFTKGSVPNFSEQVVTNVSQGVHFPFISVIKLTIKTDLSKLSQYGNIPALTDESVTADSTAKDYILIDNKYLFELNADGSLNDLSAYRKQVATKINLNKGISKYKVTGLTNAEKYVDISVALNNENNSEEEIDNLRLSYGDDAAKSKSYKVITNCYTLPINVRYTANADTASMLMPDATEDTLPSKIGNLINIRKNADGTIIGDYVFGVKNSFLTGNGKKFDIQEGKLEFNFNDNAFTLLKNGSPLKTYGYNDYEKYENNVKEAGKFSRYEKDADDSTTNFFVIAGLPVYEADGSTAINYTLDDESVYKGVRATAYLTPKGKFALDEYGSSGDFYKSLPAGYDGKKSKEVMADGTPVYVRSDIITYFTNITDNTMQPTKAGLKVSINEYTANYAKQIKDKLIADPSTWNYYLPDKALSDTKAVFDLYMVFPDGKEAKIKTITLSSRNEFTYVLDNLPTFYMVDETSGVDVKYKLKKTNDNDGFTYVILKDIDLRSDFGKGDVKTEESPYDGEDEAVIVGKTTNNKVRAARLDDRPYTTYTYKVIRWKDDIPNTPPVVPNVPIEVTTKSAIKTVTSSAVATPSTIVTPSPVQPVIPTEPKSPGKPNKSDEPTVLKLNTQTTIVSDKKPEVKVTKVTNDKTSLSNFEIFYENDKLGNVVKVVKDKRTKKIVSRTLVRKQLPVTGAVPEYIYILSGLGLLSFGLFLNKYNRKS